jgi:hypothetical protein
LRAQTRSYVKQNSSVITCGTTRLRLPGTSIREHCGQEVAQVIASDNGEMRPILRRTGNVMLGKSFSVPHVTVGPRGTIGKVEEVHHHTERVIDDVHFLEPTNAPFLQIADACAFGLRRYIANYEDGPQYLQAIADTGLFDMPSEWSAFRALIRHERKIELPP